MSGIGWDNYNDCPLWQFTEEELEEHDKQIRADAFDELETKLIDIIFGNEEFIDWQKQEINLCLECVIEQLKEQKI